MPAHKNSLVRILVPLAAGSALVAVVTLWILGNARGGSGKAPAPGAAPSAVASPSELTSPTPTPGTADAQAALDPVRPPPATADAATPAVPEAEATPAEQSTPQPPVAAGDTAPPQPTLPVGLRARALDGVPPLDPLGTLGEGSAFEGRIRFSPFGAGVESLELSREFVEVGSDKHVELQASRVVDGVAAVPLALLFVEIDGQQVNLTGLEVEHGRVVTRSVWRQLAPGRFEALIEDASGGLVGTVRREFTFQPGSHDMELRQWFENATDRALSVRFVQTGMIDMPPPDSTYGGDKRRVRYGYLLRPESQGTDPTVVVDHLLEGRASLLGKKNDALVYQGASYKAWAETGPVWPTPDAVSDGLRLVWTAFTDRYFVVALHPLVDPAAPLRAEDKVFAPVVERIDRVALNRAAGKAEDAVILLRLTSGAIEAPAGGRADASMGVYAGPASAPVLAATPRGTALGLDRVVVYNFGGLCAPCTFDWLTHALIWVLRFFEGLTKDWAIAIVLLVVVVRGALHPITRWSQIRLQRFSAQMQAVGPKQQKLREKFKDDPKRLQAETAKLWKEEGVNPAGALGCLPMFLQSPVWIALYATLFFASELRHEPAFYGVFQSMTGGAWTFLNDLSAPDHAIPLPAWMHFSFPLFGAVKSVNVLPLILGVVFFIHQKYLTPPSAATLTPEQEAQQKMIKWMSVVMFPLFMYAAPSGLAIYFITNSTLAIFENKWIRAHMTKHDLLNVEKIKAEKAERMSRRAASGKAGPAGGGFLARLQKMAEEQQRKQAEASGYNAKVRKVANKLADKQTKKTIDRKYKDRE
jgi:YidC/Oxa1 family membrane protein insertase